MNYSYIFEKFRTLSKPVFVSIISSLIIILMICSIIAWKQLWNGSNDKNISTAIESISKSWITIVSCIDLSKINIKQLWKIDNRESLIADYDQQIALCKQVFWSFWILNFFSLENDFKSSIVWDFSIPVYSGFWITTTEQSSQIETEIKEKLSQMIKINPEVTVTKDNISIYGKKIILNLDLQPETSYTISLWIHLLNDKKEAVSSWNFVTPKNVSFWARVKNGVTLYDVKHPPIIEIFSYNNEKNATSITICPIGLENYAKIEVFLKNNDVRLRWIDQIISWETIISSKKFNIQEEFFYSWIETLIEKNSCRDLQIPLIVTQWDKKIHKHDVSLHEVLESLGNRWLFVAFFSKKEDRYFNEKIQKPMLFWITNAHTTMKVGTNGEAFFFVNDFSGKPVADLEIHANINEFSSRRVTYDGNWRTEYDNSPLEKPIYSENIFLGKTDKFWILKTSLQWKIQESYQKTFENNYEYDESGIYSSFFITGKNKDHISYVSSQWNGGIAPWNFGYKVNSWYDSNFTNGDQINLTQWQWISQPFYAHIFTDRLLYLPWETVSMKSIIRDSKNLSIPKNTFFTMVISDNQWKEIHRIALKSNSFGSISHSLLLDKDSSLWQYNVVLLTSENVEIQRTYFTVEVFKKPKFVTDITLKTTWLDGEYIKIQSKKESEQYYGWIEYSGNFMIHADLIGRYYSGWLLSDVQFDYKVYRQEYYDSSYWDNCYYGCFWEPNREFYSEWSGKFDTYWSAKIDIPVSFVSSYSDYKYTVEITPKDVSWDIVSSTNSIIIRLPSDLKLWDPHSALKLESSKRFYKTGETIEITGKLSQWKWSSEQENKYIMIVKKKLFDTRDVLDIRWYNRPVTEQSEELIEIIPVWTERFSIADNWLLKIQYILPDTAEYIFEFGTLDQSRLNFKNIWISDLIKEFNNTKSISLEKNVELKWNHLTDYWTLSSRCIGDTDICSFQSIMQSTWCEDVSSPKCREGNTISIKQKLNVSDLLWTGKQFFSILTYSDALWKNPVISDNKIHVLSEKVSYKIGETARILVRLPFSKWKILWTVEKNGIEKTEYIDVLGNVFFREIAVDESFSPNAYIWVVAIDTNEEKVPEYKVWYTEIVIDKTDKKSIVKVESDKQIYAPRETVRLKIDVSDISWKRKKSELAVMVVDDSLISMMGNINTNTLEHIWIKLPFQIQTSISNIAMLKNYYFARPGIVWWSGNNDNKWWDSAMSSRNIFKNTAYYNPSIITDASGIAHVNFTLPDNLTQFRVIVISNAMDNIFGAWESFFSVKKPVTIEDKTPLILRYADRITLWANVFNQTGKDMRFYVKIDAINISMKQKEKEIFLKNWENTFVTFEWIADQKQSWFSYTMSAYGDSWKNSDIVEWNIVYAESPTLFQYVNIYDTIQSRIKDFTLSLPPNTNIEKSTYEISLSNNPIWNLGSILTSLLQYPYWCIEQTVSTLLPNVYAKKFSQYLWNTKLDKKMMEENIQAWLRRVVSMQHENGGFVYWQWSYTPDLRITPYVLRSLLSMRDMWVDIGQDVIDKATQYLVNEIKNAWDNNEKTEIFYVLAKLWKWQIAHDAYFSQKVSLQELTTHERISYAYGLYYLDKILHEKMIKTQLAIIQEALVESKNNPLDNNWYWNYDSDLALFTSLLIDLGSPESSIYEYIRTLSEKNYLDYFISTQVKSAVFSSFLKYLQTFWSKKITPIEISLNGKKTQILVSSNAGHYISTQPLSDVLSAEDTVPLVVSNLTKDPVYVTVSIKSFPSDLKKIQKYENGMTITRTISEVIDSKKLSECSNYYYSDESDWKCRWAFKEIDGLQFKKWSTYKITLKTQFSDKWNIRNFTFEDYLPATFRVLHSNFKTNTIATSQNTTQNWFYNHIEVQPNVIMAYAQSVWWWEAEYSYFVIPEFSWIFTYPPAHAYLMYDPSKRAHWVFQLIEVK